MPGLINLDFADVRAIMRDAGVRPYGIGRAAGENRAVEAARQAIASPLLEVYITGVEGILFNITGSSNLSLFEVTEAAEEIRAAADAEANIIFGTSFNERLGEEVMITVIATGFDGNRKRDTVRHSQAAQPAGAEASIRGCRPASGTSSRSSSASARRPARPPSDNHNHQAAAAVMTPSRVERTVGEPGTRPKCDDRLRRGRPGDPQVSSAASSHAAARRDRRLSDLRDRRTLPGPRVSASSGASPTPVPWSARSPLGRHARRGQQDGSGRARSRRCGRRPDDPLGENRVQQGEGQGGRGDRRPCTSLGPLQSQKAKRALAAFDVIQTVDSVELSERLDRLATEVRPGARVPVLLQV